MGYLKTYEDYQPEFEKWLKKYDKMKEYIEEFKLVNHTKKIEVEAELRPYTQQVIDTNNIKDMKKFMDFFKGSSYLGQFTFVHMKIKEVEDGKQTKNGNFDFRRVKNNLEEIKQKLIDLENKKKKILAEVNEMVDNVLEEYKDQRDYLFDFWSIMWQLPRSTYKRLEQRIEELDTYKKFNL